MRVIFKKRIHSCFASFSSHDVILVRNIDIPIPPFPGLIVWDNRGWEARVNNVEIDMGDSTLPPCVIAHTESDRELYHLEGGTERRPIGEIVKEYLAQGWQKETP